MERFDFDRSLNEFAESWYESNADRLTPEEMEHAIDEIYETWANTAIPSLGATPIEWFERQNDEELFAAFLDYLARSSVPSVLTEELTDRPSLIPRFVSLIRETTDGETIETVMELLQELGDASVFSLYVDWITDERFDDEIALHAIEVLQTGADSVADELLLRANGASDKVKDRIADVVAYAKPRDRAFELLSERFLTGADLQLYAMYLGRYGDPRAIPVLKSRAQDCDFVSFREIANAVEQLGGEMDVARDFSEDPAYIRIKGAQHAKTTGDAGRGTEQ